MKRSIGWRSAALIGLVYCSGWACTAPSPVEEPQEEARQEGEPQEEDRQEERPTPPGIAIGEIAPDFRLEDQAGTTRSLKDLRGEDDQFLAIVFYRSADW